MYQRCMVMGGGGGRLAAYLGMHEAACDAGLAPDLVIGTCGGALAAALVHAEPDPARQRAWLSSPELYHFWAGFRAAPNATLSRAVTGAAARWLDPRRAARVPQLHRGALFEAPPTWPALSWRRTGDTPHAVLLGARMLYGPGSAGQPRAGRKLFELVAMCQPDVASRVGKAAAALGGPAWPDSTIDNHLAVRSDIALMDAVRISFTDMFYLNAVSLRNEHFMGGVADLLPVELATQWAHKVWIERKAPAACMHTSAWRHVLGISAPQRLRVVDSMPVALRIDTRVLARALPRQLIEKRVQLRANRLSLQACTSEAEYQQLVDTHWHEGYRLMQALLDDPRTRAVA